MEPRIQYAKTEDGVSIAYYAMGEGPPQIYMPPFGVNHLQYEWQIPGLRERYERGARRNRYVRYDPRGFGLSDRDVKDFSIEAFVKDLEAVVDRLQLDRLQLIPTNTAAPVAIAYAAANPERLSQLVLWCGLARGSDWRAPESWTALTEQDWEIATETWVYVGFGFSQEEPLRETAALMRESVEQDTYVALTKQIQVWDVTKLLPLVKVPTLVAHRRQYRTVGVDVARRLAATIPDARLALLEGESIMTDAEVNMAFGAFFRETAALSPPAPTPTLPEGTAIILFADIADSTALTTELGDAAYREKERELDTALRAAITEAGGTPVEGKLLGDGVMAVFTSARQAIDAAQRCRDLGNDAGLPLHLGIHAGDVVREGKNVHGGAVQVASRVQSVAAPGEILVSDIVRGLARTSADVQFEDRGEHELKGIPEPQRLFAVQERS